MSDAPVTSIKTEQVQHKADALLADLERAVQQQAPASADQLSSAEYQELFKQVGDAKAWAQAEIDKVVAGYMAQREQLAAQTRQARIDVLKQNVAA